jgi:hypothetical protein
LSIEDDIPSPVKLSVRTFPERSTPSSCARRVVTVQSSAPGAQPGFKVSPGEKGWARAEPVPKETRVRRKINFLK